ncbi:MAG: hypothetical protein RUDDFDWM_001489 [Candidatus Fervidibacterota bacterium]
MRELKMNGGLFNHTVTDGGSPVNFKAINPVVHSLKNGLTVIAVEKHNHPSVVLSGWLKAGSIRDVEGKRGLANITVKMLIKGTRKYTWQQIAEELESLGAHIWTWCSCDFCGVGLRCLPKHFDRCLSILSDVLTQPSFPKEEFVKCKSRIVTELRTWDDNPWVVAKKVLLRLLYPETHPYRYFPEGEVEDIEGLNVDELREFHSRWYLPHMTTFAIVGDISCDEVFSSVERHFSGWNVGDKPVDDEKVEDPQPQPPRFEVRTISDRSQAVVMLGQLCISRSNPDYYALNVFNCILGGSAGIGRLFNRVRGIEGLAYSVYSSISTHLCRGTFTVAAGVAPESVKRAIESMRHQISAMFTDEPPTYEELSDAINYIVGSFAFSIETNGGIANAIARAYSMGLGVDYINRRCEIYRSITLEQVIEAARKHINPDALSIAVAGAWSGEL